MNVLRMQNMIMKRIDRLVNRFALTNVSIQLDRTYAGNPFLCNF